jgi:putative two-component system response regulator
MITKAPMTAACGGAVTGGTVLIADDEPQNVELVTALMNRLGYLVLTASNGPDALHAVRIELPDVVVLDVNMPGIDGIEVCRAIKEGPETWLTSVVLLTGLSDIDDRVRGLDAGADDFLTKPFVFAELSARVRALMHAKKRVDTLDSAESIILSLGLAIEARDPGTRGHCERLAEYGSAMGNHLGLAPADCATLYKGGFLHDVGKVGIPDAILLKTGPLTATEREIIERHTLIGDTLCAEFRSLGEVRAIVRHHHERLDGSGYPDRLAGARIPGLAQIINIVDAYDAMTSDRPYRAALPQEHSFAELRAEADRGWKDRALVNEFIAMLGQRQEGHDYVEPNFASAAARAGRRRRAADSGNRPPRT